MLPKPRVLAGHVHLEREIAVTLTGLQMSENLLVALAQEGDDASGC